MPNGRQMAKKARYYSSVTLIYLVTLLFAYSVFNPSIIFHSKAEALKSSNEFAPIPKKIIYGMPVRIVVPSQSIDLQIDKGEYNPVDNSWTLSGYNAQFAMSTSLPNNNTGNTFIYGHNNQHVFGPLKRLNPGDQALVYTDNNHVFTYTYDSASEVSPEDTSVLRYRGHAILTIQTCSGDWNEWRKMYKFDFTKVD